MHVFVDESIRGGTYLLCAARFRAGDLLATRAVMRTLCKPGQRRVHMAKEQAQVTELATAGMRETRPPTVRRRAGHTSRG